MFQQYTMTNAVDLHLVRTWLSFCKSVHGEICYSSRNKKQLLANIKTALQFRFTLSIPFCCLSFINPRNT
jgi:hypothetical protein